MGRSETIAKVVRPAWAKIQESRERGEPLDGAYVADVGDIYIQTIVADMEILDAIMDHRSLDPARQRLDEANARMERLLSSHRLTAPAK